MATDLAGLAAVAAGTVFTYAGLKGFSVPQAVQYLVQGKNPATLPQTAPITSPTSSTPAGDGTAGGGQQPVTGGSAQQILQATAATFGWTGAQWEALKALEMHEAGFNPKAKNPSSGALGLAQALGHGTAGSGGTLGNQYGANYGLTTEQAKAANSGEAAPQALWMCGYIKSRYGDPIKAWAFWQAQKPHWY